MARNITYKTKILDAFIPFFSKHKPMSLYWIFKDLASNIPSVNNREERHINYFIHTLMNVFLQLAAIENNWSKFNYDGIKDFPLKHIFTNEPFDFPLDSVNDLDYILSKIDQFHMDTDLKYLVPIFDFRKSLLVLHFLTEDRELGVVEQRYVDEMKKSA